MRIGLSAAKAMAEACSTPLFAVSRLPVLARIGSTAAAALDAGRGSVYLGGPATHSAWEERLLTVDQARSAESFLAVCEGRLRLLFPEAKFTPPPRAFDAICCVEDRLRAGDRDDTAALDALYLWRAEQMLTRPGQG